MGNSHSSSMFIPCQKQYKWCDACWSKIIIYEQCRIPYRLDGFINCCLIGDIYFKCKNGHRFYVHTMGKTREMIDKQFNSSTSKNTNVGSPTTRVKPLFSCWCNKCKVSSVV
jgi:hypothetical protein